MHFYTKLEHREGGTVRVYVSTLHLNKCDALERSACFMDHLYGLDPPSDLLCINTFTGSFITIQLIDFFY